MSSSPLHTSTPKTLHNAELPLDTANLPTSFVREFRNECLELLDAVELWSRRTESSSPHSVRLCTASAGLSFLLGYEERSRDWIHLVERKIKDRDTYRSIAEGHLLVAQLRAQLGDRSGARRCIERAVELAKPERNPFKSDLLARSGVMYWRINACGEARTLWSAIFKKEALAALTKAQIEVATLEIKRGRAFESGRALQSALHYLQHERNSSDKLHLLEAIYTAADKLGDRDLRRKTLFKIRELGEWAVEHDPQCGFEIARFLYRARFTQEARKLVREAIVNYGALLELPPKRLSERMRRAAENDAQLEILKAWASVGSVARKDKRLAALNTASDKIQILEDLLETKIVVGRPMAELVAIARDVEQLRYSAGNSGLATGYRMILVQSFHESGDFPHAFSQLKAVPTDDFSPSLLPMAFSIAVHVGELGFAKDVIMQFLRHRFGPQLEQSGQRLLGLYDFACATMRFAGVD